MMFKDLMALNPNGEALQMLQVNNNDKQAPWHLGLCIKSSWKDLIPLSVSNEVNCFRTGVKCT